MKEKFKSCIPVGIVSAILVMASDLFNHITGWGSFAWIAYILWTFALVYIETAKAEDLTIKKLLIFLLGLPIGVALANIMIFLPYHYSNSLIIKYASVFVCTIIALSFPGKMTYGIFCGISFSFAGLGIGIAPNSFENVMKMFIIIIVFSLFGQLCPVLTNFINKMLSKKE